MKIRIIYIILLIAISTLKGFSLAGWTGTTMIFMGSPLPDSYNESYALMTDRNMYAVGEKILFSAFNISPSTIQEACWSKVIYVHLLKTDGTSVAEEKYPLSCSGSSGFLNVPDDILTGNYYLCAYTKWMRNFSPALFSYVPLTIINPFNAELEHSGISEKSPTHTPDSRIPGNPEPGKEELRMLECKPGKEIYRLGEEIQVSIQLPGSKGKNAGRVSISVARDGLVDTLLNHDIEALDDALWTKPVPGYLPEIGGLSLSGRILAGDPPEGIENTRIELSVFGDQPNFMAYNTNPDGSFFYRIDSFGGNREMFISGRHPEHPKMELRIDNDFTNPRISFPPKPFSLDETQAGLAREIMLNMQLGKLFSPGDTTRAPDKMPGIKNETVHGLKGNKLLVGDYIELPNLREVFIELIPEVQPVTREDKTYLEFRGNELTRSASSGIDPLILLDQVPVYDVDKLLAVSPEKIHSIEVIDNLYVIGKTTYGGFIDMVSENGDMGGIDLPENSLFFRYRGFQDLPDQESPSGEENESPSKNDPEGQGSTNHDFRNCLHWEPDLDMEPGQTRDIRFQSVDQPGMYRVIIRGISEDGTNLYGQCIFRITQ